MRNALKIACLTAVSTLIVSTTAEAQRREGGRPQPAPPEQRKDQPPPRFKLGDLMPPQVLDEIEPTKAQKEKLEALEKDVRERLGKILTSEQQRRIAEMPDPDGPPEGPGGPPPGRPGARRGQGEGPGGLPPGRPGARRGPGGPPEGPDGPPQGRPGARRGEGEGPGGPPPGRPGARRGPGGPPEGPGGPPPGRPGARRGQGGRPEGPDGPPPGREGARRRPFDGPPEGPDGPPPGRPDGPPGFELGRVLPHQALDAIKPTDAQLKQIEALEKEVKTKLESILTQEQKQRARDMRPAPPPPPRGEPGPGRGPRPAGGPRGRRQSGGPGGPPSLEEGEVDLSSKAAFGSDKENDAPQPPEGLKGIGGRWYVKEGTPKRYFYRDASAFIDLFTDQIGDSDKDGVPDLAAAHEEGFLLIDSQNLPNHPRATFPNSKNPNTIRVQDFHFRIPLIPRPAAQITRVPMGPIGVAINGVVYFNPFEVGGMNAVEGYSEVWLDACCGHPQQTGVYHYHKFPSCLKTPFPDDGDRHSPVIGFAWDGYPLYGPYESKNVQAKDLTGARALDVCNGHFDPDRGYHYHVTPDKFPYLTGGYAGVPEASNSRPLARAGAGAIKNNASGESPVGSEIASVAPGNAERGKTHVVRIALNAESREIPVDLAPARVQIGPYEGAKISRSGGVVTAEFTIPGDANPGALLDCHIEFDASGSRRGPLVIKKNNAFRVIRP